MREMLLTHPSAVNQKMTGRVNWFLIDRAPPSITDLITLWAPLDILGFLARLGAEMVGA